MKVDTAALLQLIAARPQIRTMELADRLNHEMFDIDEALVLLLDASKIAAVPVIAPSGRNATGYQLTEAARAERIQAAPAVSIDSSIERAIAFIAERGTVLAGQLHAFLGLKPNELVSRELAPALADGRLVKDGGNWSLAEAKGHLPVETPAPPAQLAPRVTKPQRAVEFLKAQPGNRATNDRMRTALGLGPVDQVSAYLRSALRDGAMHRDFSDWVLGAAPVAEKVKAAPAAKPAAPVVLDSVVAVGNIIVASRDASPIPQVVVDAVAAAPATSSLGVVGYVAAKGAMLGSAIGSGFTPDTPQALADSPADPIKSTVVGDVFVSARGDAALSTAVAAIAAAAPPTFRCGIWSDGILELQRGGQIVAALTREECAQVVEFLQARAA